MGYFKQVPLSSGSQEIKWVREKDGEEYVIVGWGQPMLPMPLKAYEELMSMPL